MHYGTDRVPERLAATRATPNHPKTARVGLVLTQKLLRSLQPRNDAVGSVHPCLQSTQLLADLRDLFGCHWEILFLNSDRRSYLLAMFRC